MARVEVRPEVVREARKQWNRGQPVDGSQLTLDELDELLNPQPPTLGEVLEPVILRIRRSSRRLGGLFGA